MKMESACPCKTAEGVIKVNEWMQAGLKTGMYYLRTRAAADAIKFTVDQQALAKNKAARAAAAPKGLAATGAAEPLKVNS